MSSSTLVGDPVQRGVEEVESVTIRFAGDSGDGMQVTGTQFTNTAAIVGNDISTLPDFPAEIRAPAGSLPGVSGFQLNFSRHDIRTPGDAPDVLVAMNPAALKVNIGDLVENGTLIVNTDAFNPNNLRKAGYAANPLDDGSLSGFKVFKVPITTLTGRALEGTVLGKKQVDRSKNFFALGMMYWLYDRPLEPTIEWITSRFGKVPDIVEANERALRAGYNYGETTEMFHTTYRVRKAEVAPGKYRKITGNEATAIGFVTAAELAGRPLFYGSYPITPASDILHALSSMKNFGVKTFQAEDEIAAVCASIGACYAGHIGLTGTSGPGVALKAEAVGLAVMTELPLIVINVQRGGPSTGLPTKTEQADLLQAIVGRNGECPVAVIAPATPAECFKMAIEAVRIATRHMTPVIYLSDGYLANGAEPWLLPTREELPDMAVSFASDPSTFQPYSRDPKTLARPWAVPGTPGLEHRIGGLEKQDVTGNVSYDPANHERMIWLRAEKVARIADELPPIDVFGAPEGRVLVVGWGSTYGAITSAVEVLQKEGHAVSSIHLRYLSPMQSDLGDILSRFERVLIPEMNMGQLAMLIRAKYLVNAVSLTKVQGRPFKISEITAKVRELLG